MSYKLQVALPWVCIWLGVAWLLYLLLQSALTPPVLVLCVGLGLWLRNAVARVRSQGGPIALLPAWAQSLLLETRPLDAMAAVAVVVDAQKGIGLCVHLLAALRLDERERATFVEQLPARVRSFVLAPGLLHVMPQCLRDFVTWGDSERQVAERGHMLVEAPLIAPGDAPRDEPDEEENDEILEGIVTSPARSWSLLETVRRCMGATAAGMARCSMGGQAGFLEVCTALRDCVPDLRRQQIVPAHRPRSRSVAQAVAEFNPWPTLLRVVSRRMAAWLRARLTFSALSTTTVFAGSFLGVQLAVSPASRRIAANSARLGAFFAASSALLASVTAFATLHSDRIFGLRHADSSSFSPRHASWRRRDRFERLLDYGDDDDADPRNSDTAAVDMRALSHDELGCNDDSQDEDDVDVDDLSPSPWPAAAAMACALVCARSLRLTGTADWPSPFSAQLARRLFEAVVRLKSPVE